MWKFQKYLYRGDLEKEKNLVFHLINSCLFFPESEFKITTECSSSELSQWYIGWECNENLTFLWHTWPVELTGTNTFVGNPGLIGQMKLTCLLKIQRVFRSKWGIRQEQGTKLEDQECKTFYPVKNICIDKAVTQGKQTFRRAKTNRYTCSGFSTVVYYLSTTAW